MRVYIDIDLDLGTRENHIEITAIEAAKVLSKALTTDKDYFIAWQANIAMAFKDNAAWFKKSNTGKRNVSNEDIHRIANKAADYFLEQLTGVKIAEMKWNQV